MREERFKELVDKAFLMDSERIISALEFAKDKHSGQRRRDGTPYINHPIIVAENVIGFGHECVDANTVIGALLHDVVEDTSATIDEVKDIFGDEVAGLVAGVTEDKTDEPHHVRDIRFYEQVRRAADADPRVAMIKIADQLHNNESMDVFSPTRREERAMQAMDWFAPLAEHHGLHKAAEELRKQASRHINP